MASKKGVKGKKKYTSINYEYGVYTGGQYRGGRHVQALKRGEGGILTNQYGVQFTEAEKKALESRVNTANAKRNRMLKKEGSTKLYSGGRETGANIHDPLLMRESDFVIQQKSKSLQRFRSRADFENYMNNLARVNDRGYIKQRAMTYQNNYIEGLKKMGYPDDVIAKIQKMSPTEFQKFASQDNSIAFAYIYDEEMASENMEDVRQALLSWEKRKKGGK